MGGFTDDYHDWRTNMGHMGVIRRLKTSQNMEWLSINDVKRLVKQKMYRLQTGAHSGDQLVYDNRSGKYVGHIEQGRFAQSKQYEVPAYIIKRLNTFDNDWDSLGGGW